MLQYLIFRKCYSGRVVKAMPCYLSAVQALGFTCAGSNPVCDALFFGILSIIYPAIVKIIFGDPDKFVSSGQLPSRVIIVRKADQKHVNSTRNTMATTSDHFLKAFKV